MSRRVYFISEDLLEGKPVTARIAAFKSFFYENDYEALVEKRAVKLNDIFFFIKKIFKTRKYIFITMPPFRSFWVFLIPGAKVFLDIRDGWSIAQESGYGGTSKKKPFKAKVSRIIERFVIRRSCLAITCTPGLQSYLSKVAGREVLLIPNGISDDDLALINKLKAEQLIEKNSDALVFCCAGQFSEYGRNKVITLLNIIAQRYSDLELLIQLIGSDEQENAWVVEYFNSLTLGKGSVSILPRMNKEQLFSTMLKADYGLTILRDPSYDLGTKIYDYIALGLPVINYFDQPNNFTNYFDACLDEPFKADAIKPEIRRSALIERVLSPHFKGLIQ